MSVEAGRAAIFPHPAQDRLVADAEGAGNPTNTHAILAGAGDLILELLVVAGAFWLEDEGAPTLQTLGPLRPIVGVAVLADAFAAATQADVDEWWKASRSLAFDRPARNNEVITTRKLAAAKFGLRAA